MAAANKNTCKYISGFTLIETIVVVAIFSLIILGLLSLYDNFSKIYGSQQTTARVLVSSTLTGNELQSYAMQSSGIVSSYVFSGTTYTTDSDTLVLKLPAADSSGNIIANQSDYVVFYVSSGKLYEQVLAYSTSFRKSITKQLSDSISTISFTYNNGTPSSANQIDVDILMSAKQGHTTMSHELKQTLYLHNI